jgi:hypothetical protein
MDGQVSLGRGIAAVGILLGLIAVWVDFGPDSYWSFDGSLGGLLLILGILAVLALAGAYVTGDRDYDIAYGAVGGIGFGIYLFYPAVLAFDQWDQLDAGAWLGLCSALTFIGASVATWPTDRPTVRPSAVGAVLALAGLVMVFVGLFPDSSDGAGSYWNIDGAGHSYGILMIILVVLEALSIAAAWSRSAGLDSAVLLGGVVLGASIALPDQKAFNQFGDLDAGAWLVGIGGIVVAVGVLLMRQWSEERAATAVTTPPAEQV